MSRLLGPLKKIPPPYYSASLITVLLVLGEWNYSIIGGYERLATALGVALVAEIALSLFVRRCWPRLVSAYISGNSVLMLVKPVSNALWPFALGSAISIASKYVLTWRGRHIFNPTNFGVAALLLLAPTKITALSHQWGNEWLLTVTIYAIGVIVVSRARVLHITVTYLIAYALFAALRSGPDASRFAVELGPLTSPMYTLFVFFMITDPRTIVSGRVAQVGVAALVAAVEAGIRMLFDAHVPLYEPLGGAPAIFALFLVGPVAFIWDLERQARAAPVSAPQPVAT